MVDRSLLQQFRDKARECCSFSGGPHDWMKAVVDMLTFFGPLHNCGHGLKSSGFLNTVTLAPMLDLTISEGPVRLKKKAKDTEVRLPPPANELWSWS